MIMLCFITAFAFSSCKKCKDCQISYETLNGYSMSDLNSAASLMGYADWNAYMDASFPASELCDEALDAAEETDDSTDLDSDGTMDYRVYWDCK